MAQQAVSERRAAPLLWLAIALGALTGLLLITSMAFLPINAEVIGWNAESGALAVAGATLAAAAVALPVLRWVRARVDRRFDRAGFDAQQQVEAFAGRMAASVYADEVAADLQAVVQRTLAPSSAGVWVVRSRT